MAPLQRSKSASQTSQLQIQHFIHQHVLNKLYMTSEFNCDGCNTGGYGVRYRCSACDFDLHEQCATAPHRISANIHPHHHLILVNRPSDTHLCHVCKGVTNGLSYMCEVQLCEFNVHALCTSISVATGDKSLTLDPSQLSGTVSTTVVGGYNDGSNSSQPVLMNQQQHVQCNSQPVVVNHLQHQQMQGIQPMQLGGHTGANTSPPMMMNNNQNHIINHQQQQQMKPMVGYVGYNGMNNGQPMMVNHHHQQQQQGITTLMNSQPMMVNHHQHQQQGIPTPMNSQPMMVNHHQQRQMMPTTSFNSNANQQFMTNHHQQIQQHQGVPPVGGYNVVNNNQTVMIHHPPPPPPPPQQESSGYTKVGKLAANIISTSLIGVPIFMPRR